MIYDNGLHTLFYTTVKHPKFGILPLLTTNESWLFLTHKGEAKQILENLLKSYEKLSDEDIEELSKLNIFKMDPSTYFQYYKGFPKYAVQKDINQFLNNYLKTPCMKRRKTNGYVYFLKYGKHIKIGKTINLDKRISTLSIIVPEEIELIHTIKSNDHSKCEKYFHNKYKNKREKGEWFTLNMTDIKEIKQIKEKNF